MFDHSFGLQTQAEVYHYSATLVDVQPSEHDRVLEQGWLATAVNKQPHWYQSRSTRCCLDEIDYSIMDSAEILIPVPASELDHIYSAYCLYKGFKKYFEVGDQLLWDIFMGYKNNSNELSAWSKLRKYSEKSIETVLFAWDYREPSLKLGIKSLEHELAWAKQNGFRYVYMGPGYERVSRYKSAVKGFEWWTGSEWSRDIEHYTWLCDRDNKIKSCVDLHELTGKKSS